MRVGVSEAIEYVVRDVDNLLVVERIYIRLLAKSGHQNFMTTSLAFDAVKNG